MKEKSIIAKKKKNISFFCNRSVLNMHRTIVPIIVCRIHVRVQTHARCPNIGFVLTPVLYFSFRWQFQRFLLF